LYVSVNRYFENNLIKISKNNSGSIGFLSL